MNVEDVQFSVGVVISICSGLVGGLSVWFATQNKINKLMFRIDRLEGDLKDVDQGTNAQISAVEKKLTEEIKEVKRDVSNINNHVGKIESGVSEIKGMLKAHFKIKD